jgi:hypothetical protein
VGDQGLAQGVSVVVEVVTGGELFREAPASNTGEKVVVASGISLVVLAHRSSLLMQPSKSKDHVPSTYRDVVGAQCRSWTKRSFLGCRLQTAGVLEKHLVLVLQLRRELMVCVNLCCNILELLLQPKCNVATPCDLDL